MSYINNESLSRILRLHEAKKKSGFPPRESDDPQGTSDRDQEATDPDKNQQPPQFGDSKPAEKDGDKADKTGKKQPDAKTINKKEMRADITLTSKDKDEMDKVPAGGKTISGEKANKIQTTPIIEANDRERAINGTLKEFASGLPSDLKMFAPILYNRIRIEEGLVRIPSLNENNIADIIDIAEARREEPYEFSFKELRSLREKAESHKISVEILEQVFRRGVANWIQEDVSHLTHQQFAFNRINSFLAGGAAAELDQDLAEQALETMIENDLDVLKPQKQEIKPEHGVIISPTPSSRFDGTIRLKDPQSKVDKKEPSKSRPGKVSVQTLMRQVYEGNQLMNEVWDRNDPHSSGYHHGYHDRHMSETDLRAKFPNKEQQQAWAEARRMGTVDRVTGKPAKSN